MYVAKGPDLDVQLVPLIVTETANAASSSMNEPATAALRNQQRQTLQIDVNQTGGTPVSRNIR